MSAISIPLRHPGSLDAASPSPAARSAAVRRRLRVLAADLASLGGDLNSSPSDLTLRAHGEIRGLHR